MQSRKVMLGVFSVIVSMFITLYAGLLWFNNIFISLHWNPISGSLKDYEGLGTYFDYPFIDECLNWATIDLSTVTTAIPFFGFLFISVGLIKIIYYNRRDEQFFTSETFPFSENYEDGTALLGLIGTVFGLIMIGFYDADAIKMSDIIICLQTALFSTLTALCWILFISRPLSNLIIPRLNGFLFDYELNENQDTVTLLDRFNIELVKSKRKIKALASQINTTIASFSEMDKKASEVGKTLEKLVETITARDDKFAKHLKKLEEAHDDINKSIKDTLASFNIEAGKRVDIIKGQDIFIKSSNKLIKELQEERIRDQAYYEKLVNEKASLSSERDAARAKVEFLTRSMKSASKNLEAGVESDNLQAENIGGN